MSCQTYLPNNALLYHILVKLGIFYKEIKNKTETGLLQRPPTPN